MNFSSGTLNVPILFTLEEVGFKPLNLYLTFPRQVGILCRWHSQPQDVTGNTHHATELDLRQDAQTQDFRIENPVHV